MRYWWVNQNQTYRHEVAGGYLWSPKRNKNGARNPFYEFMREVGPGDVIFSFADTKIPAIGVALSLSYTAPKPGEFGRVGTHWDQVGWRIDVRFRELTREIRPVEHMDRLRPYLPALYSPLQANGNGMQGVYLTSLPLPLAQQLIDLIGTEARAIVGGWSSATPTLEGAVLAGQVEWEQHQLEELYSSKDIAATVKEAVILSRRGQGLFRARVAQIEARCRLTNVSRLEYLRASHTKPWRDASNEERLDGENGLLLTPDADLLFDRGLISFENSGQVLVSPVADMRTIEALGLAAAVRRNVGPFTSGQCKYLDYHRESVFLEAQVRSTD